MDHRALKRQCEARLHDLELPTPFDVRVFCDLLAARRAKPIVLRSVVTHAGPWGLWAATDSADYIFYESNTSPLHQEHIILHELGHLICDHHPVQRGHVDLREFLPDLSADTIRRMLSRQSYSRAEEQEAEVLASLLLERISQERPQGTPLSPNLAARDVEIIERFKATLRVDRE